MIGHGLAFSFAEALPQTPDDLGGAAQRRRQAEVARLVSEGLANKEVARQLGLAEGTVKLHLHFVFQKIGVSNRIQLNSAEADAILAARIMKRCCRRGCHDGRVCRGATSVELPSLMRLIFQ